MTCFFQVFVTLQTISLFNSTAVSTSIEWNKADQLPYPNLTVCFAKFFDNRLLKGMMPEVVLLVIAIVDAHTLIYSLFVKDLHLTFL